MKRCESFYPTMVYCAEEQMMKCQPTFLAEYKARLRLHSALRHAYLMKEPTSRLSSYNRPGGILVFLQITLTSLVLYYGNNRFTMKF